MARMTRPLADRVREELRVEMARQQLTQVELADRIGEGQPWVSRRLAGKTPITVDDLEAFAKAFRRPVGALLGLEASDTRHPVAA